MKIYLKIQIKYIPVLHLGTLLCLNEHKWIYQSEPNLGTPSTRAQEWDNSQQLCQWKMINTFCYLNYIQTTKAMQNADLIKKKIISLPSWKSESEKFDFYKFCTDCALPGFLNINFKAIPCIKFSQQSASDSGGFSVHTSFQMPQNFNISTKLLFFLSFL